MCPKKKKMEILMSAFIWDILSGFVSNSNGWMVEGEANSLRRNERGNFFCFLHVKGGTCCRPPVFFWDLFFRGYCLGF